MYAKLGVRSRVELALSLSQGSLCGETVWVSTIELLIARS